MRWNNDQCTDGCGDRVYSVASEAYIEHQAYEVKNKGTADTDDDRLEDTVAGEARALAQIADDTSDHDCSDHGGNIGFAP